MSLIMQDSIVPCKESYYEHICKLSESVFRFHLALMTNEILCPNMGKLLYYAATPLETSKLDDTATLKPKKEQDALKYLSSLIRIPWES